MKLINEKAPRAIKNNTMDVYATKVVACDASMAIYQFLIATQTLKQGFGVQEMTDQDGNLTAHLVGLFNRTIKFMECGIKPVWVFDGKPPEMKSEELTKRKEMREKAEEEKKAAIESGDMELAKKMAGRSIRVTTEMTQDAKALIKLMGAPIIEAPCEAEAQCVELVKGGMAYAVVTEDMDALTFGANFLLRGLNSKNEPILQIELAKLLEDLDLTMDAFIDLCILCGCDYSPSI